MCIYMYIYIPYIIIFILLQALNFFLQNLHVQKCLLRNNIYSEFFFFFRITNFYFIYKVAVSQDFNYHHDNECLFDIGIFVCLCISSVGTHCIVARGHTNSSYSILVFSVQGCEQHPNLWGLQLAFNSRVSVSVTLFTKVAGNSISPMSLQSSGLPLSLSLRPPLISLSSSVFSAVFCFVFTVLMIRWLNHI